MPEILVPDTSVLVDGRITQMVREEFVGARVVVPLAALAELEAQANRGLETGFAGLTELTELQRLAQLDQAIVEFAGRRPTNDEIEHADTGAIDALMRETAVELEGLFVTSDRVQAHAAAAQGLRHHYLRPIVEEAPDLSGLAISRFFEEDVMSVHLKADCLPMAKRGTPGALAYEAIGTKEMQHTEIRAIARECIEFAKRDYNSFLELQRHGCTVVQLGPMRITLAQPPFSDAIEVTAVRPVFKATLADYDLPDNIRARLEGRARGVFVAGPPGSGKSTFAAAVAEHLWGLDRVVKTMEQPRDLQVPKEITQYGALDRDMAWTGEIMLLVRPDHVVYDEVRTTSDFRVFADMRLAGVGLVGVTHANRAIDAVQRLIGRVDLGMIPQVVDTVVFIDAGRIDTILELRFTVKVPAGMTQEDLARPVVVVSDVSTGEDLFELYTYGEQVVVMPLEEVEGRERSQRGTSALAEREVQRILARYVKGSTMDVEMRGNSAVVYVEDWAVPQLIGKGGRTVQALQDRLGIRLDVRSSREQAPGPRSSPGVPRAPPGAGTGRSGGPASGSPVHPEFKKTGSNIFLSVGSGFGGRDFRVEVEGAVVDELRASAQGKLRFKANSPEGKALASAHQQGLDITCVPV